MRGGKLPNELEGLDNRTSNVVAPGECPGGAERKEDTRVYR